MRWPALIALLLCSACAPVGTPQSRPAAPAPVADTPGTPTPTPPPITATRPAPTPPQSERLAAEFAALSAELPGRVGLAVAPVGGSGPVTHVGQWRSGVAWSTSKVPLAIAATRHSPTAATRATARRAIVSSDNAAAAELWTALGTPERAAEATGAVIAELGGGRVRVESKVLRPEYSSFGQTEWSLASQAEFAARLPCRAEAREVYAWLGETDAEQRWGVAGLPGAHFKGGWGPGRSGGYLVRQLGVIETPRGRVAVAMAAEPASGAYQDGTRMLTRIGRWLGEHPDLLPAGRC